MSLNSDGSIHTPEFAAQVDTLRTTISVAELTTKATELISILADNLEEDKTTVSDSHLLYHRVLQAMLDHADVCSGESALRYCAAAICACARFEGGVDLTILSLKELGQTWISDFLYPFKSTYSRSNRASSSSGPATPTLKTTPEILGGHVDPNRRTSKMKELVLERDGYRCLVTGKIQEDSPPFVDDPTVMGYTLECAHIFKRAMAAIGQQDQERFKESGVHCLDILKNYCGLFEEMLGNLSDVVDSPMNNFMLVLQAHSAFSRFNWSLVPTGVENQYKVKIFNERKHQIETTSGLKPEDLVIEFKDRRLERAKLDGIYPLPKGIPLPEPILLRIHAAVAGILQMSGAGNFLDEILEKYDNNDDGMDMPSFEEVLRTVQCLKFKELLRDANDPATRISGLKRSAS